MVVTISHTGYIKAQPIDDYRSQRRGGRGKVIALSLHGGLILSAIKRERGIKARVLDLRWLAPLPWQALEAHARQCKALLVVDECRATHGGPSPMILTQLCQDPELAGCVLRRVAAVEQPDRLQKQAAQRLQRSAVRRAALCSGLLAAALHKAQVGLALDHCLDGVQVVAHELEARLKARNMPVGVQFTPKRGTDYLDTYNSMRKRKAAKR